MPKDIFCNNICTLWIPCFCTSVVIFYFYTCNLHYIAAIFGLDNYILKWLRDECLLYIPPAYFYRSLFMSMQVSLGIIPLLPEGLFLTFSSNISLLVTNSFSFCLKNFYFFIFERYIHFSGYSILDILIFFFQHFKTVSPLSSGLYTFWEFCCISYLCSHVCNVLFFSHWLL